MSSTTTTLIIDGIRAAGSVSPRLGAAAALPLFRSVRPRVKVRPADRATHEDARRGTVRIPGITGRGVSVRTYEWGRGAHVVLLAHGWRGRASQFATLVRELVAEGFRVVAFDAPANGDSGGRATYIVDWIDAMLALQQRHGQFHAIVGHSFGTLAAICAVADGVTTRQVVGIAGVADADALVSEFGSGLRLTPATTAALGDRFARRVFPEEPDLYGRYSGVAHPLPADVPLLLVHDDTDATVPVAESRRLAAAHAGRARLVVTHGAGHNRVLAADETLDAIVEFTTAGLTVDDRVPVVE